MLPVRKSLENKLAPPAVTKIALNKAWWIALEKYCNQSFIFGNIKTV